MQDAERGQISNEAADVYDEFFVPALFGQWTGAVLDAAGVRPGARVLDVGCGTGVLARSAAARVGATGRVVGIDPNEGMLAVARRHDAPVEWRSGIAESLPFPDGAFDHVVSQFAAMFFTDRLEAGREMLRVARPGGTVTIATWGALDTVPGYSALAELLARLFGPGAVDALRAPFALGEPDALRTMFSGSPSAVAVRRHEGVARFPSIEAWIHTEVRGWTLADTIDDDGYAALVDEARSALAPFADGAGRVAFPAPALIATARRMPVVPDPD